MMNILKCGFVLSCLMTSVLSQDDDKCKDIVPGSVVPTYDKNYKKKGEIDCNLDNITKMGIRWEDGE